MTNSTKKLRLDTINKILKIESSKDKKRKRESLSKNVSKIALFELIKGNARNNPDFKLFLQDEENVRVFREFLQSQYCQENLDFYLACERYKRLDPLRTGHELLKFLAIHVYKTYLAKDAPQPVNVDSACARTVGLGLDKLESKLFDEAQTEIFNLMESDCFPRFCKTWLLDHDLARQIIEKTARHQPDESQLSTHSFRSITNALNYNDTIVTRSRRESTGSGKTTLSSLGSESTNSSRKDESCSPECPYYSIGRLPCQKHGSRASLRISNRLRQEEMSQHTDLRAIHKLPDCLRPKRTPPPPPLPPKIAVEFSKPVRRASTRRSKVDMDQPYVGKVFHV